MAKSVQATICSVARLVKLGELHLLADRQVADSLLATHQLEAALRAERLRRDLAAERREQPDLPGIAS